MVGGLGLDGVIIAIVLGVLFAIVYSLRILVLLERRIARMDESLLKIVHKIELEEEKIEAEEEKIESLIKRRMPVTKKKKR